MSSHKSARWLSVKVFLKELSHRSSVKLSCSFYVISCSTPFSPFIKRILIKLFHDSTARKHSHNCKWKIFKCSLMSLFTDCLWHFRCDHEVVLIQSIRPQTYSFTTALILSWIWTPLQPFPEDLDAVHSNGWKYQPSMPIWWTVWVLAL